MVLLKKVWGQPLLAWVAQIGMAIWLGLYNLHLLEFLPFVGVFSFLFLLYNLTLAVYFRYRKVLAKD